MSERSWDGHRHWLFDVDGTLVDSFDATELRPLVLELFETLRDANRIIDVWSAGGADHARIVIVRHGLDRYVSAYDDKRIGEDGRWLLPDGVSPADLVCVDDQPAQLPAGVSTIAVFPYLRANPHDRALAPALARLSGRPK